MTFPYKPIEPGLGYARARSLAFDAVRKLWKLRQSEGMTQAELAERLDRNRGWVSKKLSGPTNWTLRTFGDLIDALDGEIEIRILDLKDGPQTGNYDAYAGYGEEPMERRLLAATEGYLETPRGFAGTDTYLVERGRSDAATLDAVQ